MHHRSYPDSDPWALVRIRIRQNDAHPDHDPDTDPDPQHWLLQCSNSAALSDEVINFIALPPEKKLKCSITILPAQVRKVKGLKH